MADMKSLKDSLDCNLVDKFGCILGSYENCLLITIEGRLQNCKGCFVDVKGDSISVSQIHEIQVYKRGSNDLAVASVSEAARTTLGIRIKFYEIKDISWVKKATGIDL